MPCVILGVEVRESHSMFLNKSLLSLFNGISTFVGYLMPKTFLQNTAEKVSYVISIIYIQLYGLTWLFLFNNPLFARVIAKLLDSAAIK